MIGRERVSEKTTAESSRTGNLLFSYGWLRQHPKVGSIWSHIETCDEEPGNTSAQYALRPVTWRLF